MERRLVWMDMEMTGLNPDRDRIIEMATLVTDEDLRLIAEGPTLVIHQHSAVLDAMDNWNTEHHTASGLLALVKSSTITERMAEARTLVFLEKHVATRSAPLCGNSICQDRRFLARYMPELDGFLHYRNVDVSTIKELARRWYPALEPFQKSKAHTALADIRESIEELKYYRERIFNPVSG